MTDSKTTKKLTGIPPGRGSINKERAMTKSQSRFQAARKAGTDELHFRPETDSYIFEAIEKHQEALATLNATIDQKEKYEEICHRDRVKPDGRFNKREDKDMRLETEALWNLITCVPCTLVGVVTMLRYVRLVRSNEEMLGDGEMREMFHSSIEQALCQIAGLPHPYVWNRRFPKKAAA